MKMIVDRCWQTDKNKRTKNVLVVKLAIEHSTMVRH